MRIKTLKHLKVLVTAGPTREFFDPVRFLSNPSSGKMGYAIAEEAARLGARVTLISGPVAIRPPGKIKTIRVVSALQMHKAVLKEASSADVVVMTAAVSDYRPMRYSKQKIKKGASSLRLSLAATPDILQALGRQKRPGQILVGFAAETNHVEKYALEKLRRKNLDVIVANQVGQKRGGFEDSMNRAFFLAATGKKRKLPLMSKEKIARNLWKFVTMFLDDRFLPFVRGGTEPNSCES